MQHPLLGIPKGKRLTILLPLLVLTRGLGVGIGCTPQSERHGIVTQELAGDEQKAYEVIES